MSDSSRSWDVLVVGAGVFGAWTAWHLAQRKQRVLLLDAFGPAHSRASSGGESRIIRMGYGADAIYTAWSLRSLEQWKSLFSSSRDTLFHPTGVLWLTGKEDAALSNSLAVFRDHRVPHELLDPAQLAARYPQLNLDGITRGLLEPQSGVLMARRSVACTVEDACRLGVQFEIDQILPPAEDDLRRGLLTSSGRRLSAAHYVFACGPWLGKLFPALLGSRIFPTRQEIFFFAPPPGDSRFAPPALPTWFFQDDEVYGMPDIESRGLKVACDIHGERVDPDTNPRLITRAAEDFARDFLRRRFPSFASSPITETRVCQYENTSNGDFLIDRHPSFPSVWFAGGGSGHGFKHGPAFGEYLAGQILGSGAAEPRFSLASKETLQNRSVH